MCFVFVPVRLRHEDLDRITEHFIGVVAEQILGLTIREDDRPIGICDDRSLRGCMQKFSCGPSGQRLVSHGS